MVSMPRVLFSGLRPPGFLQAGRSILQPAYPRFILKWNTCLFLETTRRKKRGTGVFKFGEIVLLKKESEDIPLPGSISLGAGIAL